MADEVATLMSPWWKALRYATPDISSKTTSDHVYSAYEAIELSIDLGISMDGRTLDVVAREAIELVALLAFVDYDAYLQGLMSCISCAATMFCPEREQFSPRFNIKFDVAEDDDLDDQENQQMVTKELQHAVQRMFEPLLLKQRSPAYRETREQLLGRAGCPDLRRKYESLKTPVVMMSDTWNSGVLDDFLSMAEAVYARQRQPQDSNAVTSQLVLEAVDITVDYPQESRARAAKLGAHLAQRAIPLRRLAVNETEGAASIICGGMTVASPTHYDMLCSDITIEDSFDSDEETTAVFSSIAANQVLKSMMMCWIVNWNEPDSATIHRSVLKWAAFVAFSPYAMNSLDYFDFECNALSLQDAAAIAEVVSAANPLQVLLNSSEEECKTSSLLEDVELPVDSHGTSAKLRAGLNVWVVHNRSTEPFMMVLVPGHGVHRMDRSKLSTPVKPVLTTPAENVFLMLSDEVGDMGGFPGLIPMLDAVGKQLAGLDIWIGSSVHELTMMDIRNILRSCPRLKYLMINGAQVESLDGIVDAYEADDCRIQQLLLSTITMTNGNGTERFLDALEHEDSAVSRHLLEFRVDDLSWLARDIENATRLAKVLNRNRTLQVVIACTSAGQDDARVKALEQQIDKDVFVRCDLLPLRSKLAFLSAMSSSVYPAAEHVDSEVARMIFDFASPGIKRVVHVVHR
ncbi:hypothetical protein Poli38472_011208 [Pythium oligandrum]|uniref:Uncharacterized protein n=1 Tax=Pythium oligandrum TaxID=41045 RepID=A0A8K1FRH6_PYTOL|nr:hypothetical protein Poli38472_011208 [Pythium oligandrum]|eukprot:TMW67588.1 hypothetical protein Poli38472_011208 [Pythium oligandrum]